MHAPGRLLVAVGLSVALWLAVAVPTGVPLHPHLARSSWPIVHADPLATNSVHGSSYSGPMLGNGIELVGQMVETPVAIGDLTANAISMMFSEGGRQIWTTTISQVACFEVVDNTLHLVDSYRHPLDYGYHGAYGFVSNQNVYYSSTQSGFGMYQLDATRKIQKVGDFTLSEIQEMEAVVGVLINWNASIVMATSIGRVFVLERADDKSFEYATKASLQLSGGGSPEFVSNSFALDHNGGIYVVSKTSLHKLHFDAEARTLQNVFDSVYSDGNDPLFLGRLGKGSGSTPSVQVDKSGAPKYVIISDGRNPMNVLSIDAVTGDLRGNRTVTFGIAGSNTQSEQSVTVMDHGAVVVNNWLEHERLPLTCRLMQMLPKLQTVKIQKACAFGSGTLADAGVEHFSIDPATGSLESKWHRKDVQCSSSIPAAGLSGVATQKSFYCIGQRLHQHEVPNPGDDPLGWLLSLVHPSTTFTLEALDWDDGSTIYSVPVGPGTSWNPMYAAVQIGSQSDILYGTGWGVVRISARKQEVDPPLPPLASGLLGLRYAFQRQSLVNLNYVLVSLIVGFILCVCTCCRRSSSSSSGPAAGASEGKKQR